MLITNRSGTLMYLRPKDLPGCVPAGDRKEIFHALDYLGEQLAERLRPSGWWVFGGWPAAAEGGESCLVLLLDAEVDDQDVAAALSFAMSDLEAHLSG